MNPTTFRKLGEIRANPPERSSEAAYEQQRRAREVSRSAVMDTPKDTQTDQSKETT